MPSGDACQTQVCQNSVGFPDCSADLGTQLRTFLPPGLLVHTALESAADRGAPDRPTSIHRRDSWGMGEYVDGRADDAHSTACTPDQLAPGLGGHSSPRGNPK